MSPEDAFEELCSQISRNSPPSDGAQFIRNGTPDGGVEFYWILKNKKISGWQCKFFQGSLTPGQWVQLDKSFQDALDKYPELSHYVVALPQDLAQGREQGKKSFRQKWEERTKKWTALARSKKRTVKIEYFGDAEIFNFLDVHDQSGRRWYWFEQTALTQQWFERRLTEAIANAGARYTPELNIELPLTKTLEFLGRTEIYRTLLLTHRGVIRKNSRHVLSEYTGKLVSKARLVQISSSLRFLDESLTQACDLEMPFIPWKSIREESSRLINTIREAISVLRKKKERKAKPKSHSPNSSDMMGIKTRELEELQSAVYGFIREIDQVSEEVTNLKALLLTGNAGSGKTHILCDYASERVRNKAPTVLLYGEHFQDGEPWSQICRQLQLGDIGADRLLQALESAAQSRQVRSLIIIDGLNEGPGKALWKKYLPGMLATLSQYNWVGIAISLRSGFETYIAEQGKLERLQLVEKYHAGFSDLEFDAIPEFCRHYGLSMPSVPVLLPEFQNPLFLKLTCESLRTSKEKQLNLGIIGVNATFESFVGAVNRKLSERLGLDPKDNLVKQSLYSLCKEMADSKESSLPYAKAKFVVNKIHTADTFEKSLFSQLISEGVLTETFRYRSDMSQEEHIRFSYERHSDHLVADYLLSQFATLEILKDQFQSDKLLGEICAKPYRHRGLLEALSIQIPEKYGQELCTLIPAALNEFQFAEILLAGLMWRAPSSIDAGCIDLLLKWTNKYERFGNTFLDTLVALSAIPSHPLNADLLNKLLFKQPLTKRDYLWTRFVSEYANYGRETAVGRLIDWLSAHEGQGLSDESARLYGVALIWMLGSPNRILRDRASKSLVRLMETRISVLTELMKQFANIDDAYISERIYAVAYGCALRTDSPQELRTLGEFIFGKQFESGTPETNILLRDYARGVIEICVANKVVPDDWLPKANPPYKEVPLPVFPSQKSVEKYKTDKTGTKRSSLSRLYYSIMGDSDFVKDVIQSNLEGRWLTKKSRGSRRIQKNANRWNRLGQIDWRGPQRWILHRIVELGWKEKLFIDFDNEQYRRSRGRYDHKFEGFDTKYAFIALYEILAHLQDSADFNDADLDVAENVLLGPWQLSYMRNIDVSRLEPARELKIPDYMGTLPKQPDYDNWHDPKEEWKWVKTTADLPNPIELLASQKWLLLDGTFDWEEPTEPGEDKYDSRRRSFWYSIQGYFVKSSDAELLSTWLSKQNMIFRDPLPEPPHSHNIFLGEYFRTLAFQYQNTSYYSRTGWTKRYDEKLPAQVLVTTDGYLNESGVYDQSFDETVNFKLPCEWLINELKLAWNGEAGFVNSRDELVAFDPIYWNSSPSRLAINRATLIPFLKKEKLEVVWWIRGRKCVLGEHWGTDEFPGQLEMNAICRTTAGKLIGTMSFIHINTDRKQRKLRSRDLSM